MVIPCEVNCLYQIKNLKNGKLYIGISNDPWERWGAHKIAKKNHPLYNAFRAEGIQNFEFSILLKNLSRKEAGERKRIYC